MFLLAFLRSSNSYRTHIASNEGTTITGGVEVRGMK